MAELNIVTVGDTVIELRLPREIGPVAIRALCGTTNQDAEIDLLEIPTRQRGIALREPRETEILNVVCFGPQLES